MKNANLFVVVLLFAARITYGQLVPDVDSIRSYLVDKDVTERAAIMYYNMLENSKKGIMIGQQDAFTSRQINYPDPNMSDIKYTTGQNPLVGGLDLMFITDIQNTPGSWFEEQEKIIKAQAVQNYYRGIITTFTWHFRNPYTKDWFSVNGNPERVAIAKKSIKSLIPGGENHEYYKAVLQKVASVFEDLKDSTDVPIPVFFRPFHEFDGDWFWWGKPYCTASEFKEIWHFTVHYLRDSLDVHNILYAFSPDNRFNTLAEYLERYPGDDYVDLVGMDNYYDFESNNISGAAKKLKIVSDYAISSNKLAALTECGYRNTTKPDKLYTGYFLKALNQYPLQLSYLMFWGNGKYTPIPGQNTAPDFIDFMNNPLILAEGDVDDLFSFPFPQLEFVSGVVTEEFKNRLDVTLSTEPDTLRGFEGFTVKLDSNFVEIDSVLYSNVDELLYLYISTDVANNQTVTLSYTHGNVVSKDGLNLIDFADQPIENLLIGSAPLLKSAYTSSDGNFIYLEFNKPMAIDGFNADSLTIFESNVINSNINFKPGPFLNDDFTILTIETVDGLYAEYAVFVSYSDDAFSSTDGGRLAKINNYPVINQSPGMSPKLLSGEVLDDGSGVKLLFNKELDPVLSAKDGFKITVNGDEKLITGITYLLNTITLLVNQEIVSGDTVAISFSGANIVAVDRGVLSSIISFNIQNSLVPIYVAKHFGNVVISASAPSFKIDSAYIGNLMYIDRSYFLTDLSNNLLGAEYLIWQNGLKSYYTKTLLTVTLINNGILYVAHDDRLSKPGWLTENFTKTDYSFSVPDSRLTLYYRYVSKDQIVELGANQVQGTETGSSTNYIVFFVPADIPSHLSNIPKNTFKIFPNPCRNEFSIQLDDYSYHTIEIFNLLGKLEYSAPFDMIQTNKVSVSFKPGVYVVRLRNNSTTISSLLTVY
jgi:mannan endo-1,4-beta-mannosidase